MRCFGAWQLAMHHAREAVAQAFGTNAPITTMSVCNLCQAGHASACPLANRESEQTAPRDALLFESWQCITYADKSNIKRFALSGLVHPHIDACVQTLLPRSCIYVSPGLLSGLTGCTMRCFGVWQLAMHHARRRSSSSLRD